MVPAKMLGEASLSRVVSYIASFQALLGLGFAFGLFLCTFFFIFIKIKVFPVLSSSPFLKLLFFQPQGFIGEKVLMRILL